MASVHQTTLVLFSYLLISGGKARVNTRGAIIRGGGDVLKVGKINKGYFFSEATFIVADSVREDERFDFGTMPNYPHDNLLSAMTVVAQDCENELAWKKLITAYDEQFEGVSHPATWDAYKAYRANVQRQTRVMTRAEHKELEAAERRERLNRAAANSVGDKISLAKTIAECVNLDAVRALAPDMAQVVLSTKGWKGSSTEFFEAIGDVQEAEPTDSELFDQLINWSQGVAPNTVAALKLLDKASGRAIMEANNFPLFDYFADWHEVSAFVNELKQARQNA